MRISVSSTPATCHSSAPQPIMALQKWLFKIARIIVLHKQVSTGFWSHVDNKHLAGRAGERTTLTQCSARRIEVSWHHISYFHCRYSAVAQNTCTASYHHKNRREVSEKFHRGQKIPCVGLWEVCELRRSDWWAVYPLWMWNAGVWSARGNWCCWMDRYHLRTAPCTKT